MNPEISRQVMGVGGLGGGTKVWHVGEGLLLSAEVGRLIAAG